MVEDQGDYPQKTPKVLYKYRSLAGKQNKLHVRDILLKNEIYLSSPDSFNDPFDCSPAFCPTFTREGAYALARRALSGEHPKWDEKKLDSEARKFVSQVRNADMAVVAEELRHAYVNLRKVIATYCVSANPRSALMWSHYADSHKGVCLGFDANVDIFAKAQRVSYSSTRSAVDPVHDSNREGLSKSLLLKAYDWRYEREWRYIDFRRLPGIHRLPENALCEVVLGARISASDEGYILEWIADMKVEPRIVRAVISHDHFRVDLTPHHELAWWTRD